MSKALSVPEQHQLRIARDTLKMSDAGALVMGGPSKEEARGIIQRLTGCTCGENTVCSKCVARVSREFTQRRGDRATHSAWSARHKHARACTAHDTKIGGGCFNCGWPGE